MATTKDVVESFINHKMAYTPRRDAPLNGIWRWHGSSLSSTGETLISYETMIAKWHDGKVAITDNKYSSTTSRQVSLLRSMCLQAGIKTDTL